MPRVRRTDDQRASRLEQSATPFEETPGVRHVFDQIERADDIEQSIVGHAFEHALENAWPHLGTGGGNGPTRELHTLHVETTRGGDFHEVSAGTAHVEEASRPEARADVSQAVFEMPDFHWPGFDIVAVRTRGVGVVGPLDHRGPRRKGMLKDQIALPANEVVSLP